MSDLQESESGQQAHVGEVSSVILPAPPAPSAQGGNPEAVAETASCALACALPAPNGDLPAPSPGIRPFGGLSAPSWLAGSVPCAEPALQAATVSRTTAASQPLPIQLAPAQVVPAASRTAQKSPPPGVRLFGHTEDGRRCCVQDTELLWKWTWEGAKEWLAVADHPVPASEPCFAPQYDAKCPLCPTRTLRANWHEFSNGTRHLRCECARCGKHIGYVREPFKNAWVWWRLAASQK